MGGLYVDRISGFMTRNQQKSEENWHNALELRKLLRRKFYVKTVFKINREKIFFNKVQLQFITAADLGLYG